jgi:endonuclease YncB( thermonuclease family)
MRRAAIALALVGLGGAAAAVVAMTPAREPEPAPMERPVVAKPAAPQEATASRSVRVRPIAPETVAQPELQPHTLVRVEPRAPLSTFEPPKRKRKNHGRVFRPLIHSAGEFAGSGLAIKLAGIVPTEPEQMCKDAAGTEWACGKRARAAFRSFVRGRAMLCDLPEEVTQRAYTVGCSLGEQDVAGWLVAQGWAAAAPDGEYAAVADAARAAGKGIYGAAPVIEPLPDPEPFVSALPEPLAPPAAD